MTVKKETHSKIGHEEMIIFTKFHKKRTKIVDFLLMAKFLMSLFFLQRINLTVEQLSEGLAQSAWFGYELVLR